MRPAAHGPSSGRSWASRQRSTTSGSRSCAANSEPARVPMAQERRLHVAIVVPQFPLERYARGYPHMVETIERLTEKCDVDVIALRDRTAHGPYRMAGAEAPSGNA